jgi:hypothetical protein
LLAFSRRRATRLAWNIGSGLLALTTAKLLVPDLAAAGTLARVVSFVGVGFLFLLVAFLMPAPLPARRRVPPVSASLRRGSPLFLQRESSAPDLLRSEDAAHCERALESDREPMSFCPAASNGSV